MKTKKQQIKQKITATVVVFFMFLMIFGSMDALNVNAETVTNTDLIQNIVAGALQLETKSALGFNNITVAVAVNSLANLDIVNARDYRGTGAGWSVTGTMNNMLTSADAGTGSNEISNAVIAWAPGSKFACDGASNTGVTTGAAAFFDAERTLITATANNGMGNYRVNGTTLNVVYNGRADQKTGTYQNILTLTIS